MSDYNNYYTMENFSSKAILVLFLASCVAYIYLRIVFAVRRAKKMKSQIVIARVKTEKDGKWICKFFLCGNHSGFFSQKPSSDRVKALVVGYDEKNNIYKLEELKGSI